MSLGLKYKNNEQIFAERQRGGVPYLSYPLFENTGIVNHGFSTRLGGVSTGCFSSMNISLTRGDDPEAVKKNRELIAQAIGVEVADFTYTQQTHTTNVKRVYARERGQSFPETDGMITDVPGICLVTSYADCVPLYFVDPVKKVIGLSHSGWRGTVGKIGKVTVEKMEEEFGCDPADILGAVGPSICQDCYEVSEDVADAFKEEFGAEISQDDSTSCYSWNGKSILMNKGNGKYQLDLWGANRLVLLDAGILPEHLAVTNVCTKCNPDLLYSHRVMGDKRGNLAAFLSLK